MRGMLDVVSWRDANTQSKKNNAIYFYLFHLIAAIRQPSSYGYQPNLVLLSNILISQADHKRSPPVLNSALQVLILRSFIDTSYKERLQV